jgi:hypothetical protein
MTIRQILDDLQFPFSPLSFWHCIVSNAKEEKHQWLLRNVEDSAMHFPLCHVFQVLIMWVWQVKMYLLMAAINKNKNKNKNKE